MITNHTQLNAVIGFPLTHSHSPLLHNALYQKLGIDAVLVALEHRDIKELAVVIKTAKLGLTVITMPHKRSIIPFLNKVDKQAKTIGAVNTVINKNGKLAGFNTDVDGIAFALRGVQIKGKNVLILGAGGAARAVAYYCGRSHAKIFYHNRTKSNAENLRKSFGGNVLASNELDGYSFDVIINATSIGMEGKNLSPISKTYFHPGQTIFDVVYNVGETKFVKDAKLAGARTISGMDMFIGQALKQIELYSGKKIINEKNLNFVKKLLKA